MYKVYKDEKLYIELDGHEELYEWLLKIRMPMSSKLIVENVSNYGRQVVDDYVIRRFITE